MNASLRERALRLLARREHTRAELSRKLATHGTEEEIQTLLTHLETAGLLSDARFAEAFVATRGARLGSLKLHHELRSKGVSETLIEAYACKSQDEELQRAQELWLRKFGTPPADAREYARQTRFLMSRGFAGDIVHRLLKDLPEQDA